MFYLIVIITIFFIIKKIFQYKSTNITTEDSNIFNSGGDQIQDADFEELD